MAEQPSRAGSAQVVVNQPYLYRLNLHSKRVSVAYALVAILLYEALGIACRAVGSARTTVVQSAVSIGYHSSLLRVNS